MHTRLALIEKKFYEREKKEESDKTSQVNAPLESFDAMSMLIP